MRWPKLIYPLQGNNNSSTRQTKPNLTNWTAFALRACVAEYVGECVYWCVLVCVLLPFAYCVFFFCVSDNWKIELSFAYVHRGEWEVSLGWRYVIVNWLLEWVAQIHNSILYVCICIALVVLSESDFRFQLNAINSHRLDSNQLDWFQCDAMQCDLSCVRFEWQNSLFLHPTNTHTHTHADTHTHAYHTLHIAHSRSSQATHLSSWPWFL